MSVLAELSMFPMDKGVSLSPYVARAVSIIKESGLNHQLHAMGTLVEGEWQEVMQVVNRCFEDLAQESDRVYLVLKIDYQAGKSGRLAGKVESVAEKMDEAPKS
jgi:uncharacterized protein (TIGR00106 family)